MNAQRFSNRTRRLKRVLQSPRAERLAEPIRTLACAVWNIPDDPAMHARCEAELPAWVASEIEGWPAAQTEWPIRRHLLRCDDCADMYADLLEIGLMDVVDRFRASPVPAPDLSFLEALNGRAN